MKHPIEEDRSATSAINTKLKHASLNGFRIVEDEDDEDDESESDSPEVVLADGRGYEVELVVKVREIKGKTFTPGSGSWQRR